jgi:hypothetical protein
MKNERNPEIASLGSGVAKRLLNFARALSKNDEDVYEYILLMVRGDFKAQEDSCDCIFAHLRNILSTEMNTNILKYASRVFPPPLSSSPPCSSLETCTSTRNSSPTCCRSSARRSWRTTSSG